MISVNNYTYSDKRASPAKIVFECVAADILAADKLYREATKQDPVKQPYVGCEIAPSES